MPTYGSSSATTTQYTVNWNALLTSTLFNYNKKLNDQISKRNIIWKKAIEKGLYEPYSGGIAIEENLLYALNNTQYYTGYDPIRREVIDGVTKAVFEQSEMATSIMISDTEKLKNKGKAKVLSLLDTKIKQAEMGIKENWTGDFLQGRERTLVGGTILAPAMDPITGATGVDPLAKLIAYDPTTSLVVGGINQSTSTWWRNKTANNGGVALKPLAFLDSFSAMHMACSNNSLGSPDIILTDDVTYRLLEQAMRHDHREIKSYSEYPDFENFKFKNSMVVWDDRVPNAFGGSLDASTVKGSAYFINTDYVKVRYEESSNFVNTPFMRPIDQLADVSYILWRGCTTLTNRRAHGVIGNIARTLDLT